MTYSLGEAAKATGLSKSTILRAIRTNKISAIRNERNQGWIIEPSELHRLYPAVANDAPVNAETARHETHETVMELRLRLETVTQRLADQEAVITDLREDRNQWRNQAQRLAISDQRGGPSVIVAPPPVNDAAPAKRRWWQFGKQA
jgi:excisionase family DNA binding protein